MPAGSTNTSRVQPVRIGHPEGMRSSEVRRALVFDMDGTVVDNMGFHTEAWMVVIEELGLAPHDPVTWERRTSGTPNRQILREILGLHNANDTEVMK